MPYCQLYYHLVWGTKKRAPLLIPEVEALIYGFIRSKAMGLGAAVHALNGIEDHVHLIAEIPPAIAVSTFIGQVKGVASARLSKLRRDEAPFAWQAEYGAFSFGRKQLPDHVAYVLRQKEHHRSKHLIPALEQLGQEKRTAVAEQAPLYAVADDDWWHEMLQL